MKDATPKKCQRCGEPIYQKMGRPRKYCAVCAAEMARLQAAAKRNERRLRTDAKARAAGVASRAALSRLEAIENGVEPDAAPVTVSVARGVVTITRGRNPGGFAFKPR